MSGVFVRGFRSGHCKVFHQKIFRIRTNDGLNVRFFMIMNHNLWSIYGKTVFKSKLLHSDIFSGNNSKIFFHNLELRHLILFDLVHCNTNVINQVEVKLETCFLGQILHKVNKRSTNNIHHNPRYLLFDLIHGYDSLFSSHGWRKIRGDVT